MQSPELEAAVAAAAAAAAAANSSSQQTSNGHEENSTEEAESIGRKTPTTTSAATGKKRGFREAQSAASCQAEEVNSGSKKAKVEVRDAVSGLVEDVVSKLDESTSDENSDQVTSELKLEADHLEEDVENSVVVIGDEKTGEKSEAKEEKSSLKKKHPDKSHLLLKHLRANLFEAVKDKKASGGVCGDTSNIPTTLPELTKHVLQSVESAVLKVKSSEDDVVSKKDAPILDTEKSLPDRAKEMVMDFLSGSLDADKENKSSSSCDWSATVTEILAKTDNESMQRDTIVKEVMNAFQNDLIVLSGKVEGDTIEDNSEDPSIQVVTQEELMAMLDKNSSAVEVKEGESADIVQLSQLDKNMVLVTSVQIEDAAGSGNAEADQAPIIIEDGPFEENEDSSPSSKAKPSFDKSKLFSKMEDTFAKDTHNALKNKPVYRKRLEVNDIEAPAEKDPVEKIVGMKEPGEVAEEESSPEKRDQETEKATENGSKSATPTSKVPAAKESDMKAKESEDKDTNCSTEVSKEKTPPTTPLATPSSDITPPVSNTPATPPVNTVTSPGGSELTKSLRKVRVRRTRTASSSNADTDNNASVDILGNVSTTTTTSFTGANTMSKATSNLFPPDPPELEPFTASSVATPTEPAPKLIRPRLLLSPKRHLELSEKKKHSSGGGGNGNASHQPLQIVIPDVAGSPNSMQHSSDSGLLDPPPKHQAPHRPLLMTPSTNRNRRHNPQVLMAPAVLSDLDALSVSFAVMDGSKPPRVTLNGEVISGGGTTPTNGHSGSLKTIIKLPKSSHSGGSKKKTRRKAAADYPNDEFDSDEDELVNEKRKIKIFNRHRNGGDSPRGSTSPLDLPDIDRLSGEDADESALGISLSGEAAALATGRTRTPESLNADGNALAE